MCSHFDFVIAKADKGGATVIMDVEGCISKAYKKLNEDTSRKQDHRKF